MNSAKLRTIGLHHRARRVISPFLILFISSFICSCGQTPERYNFDFEHYFIFSIGEIDFYAQLALSKTEVQEGLMYRKSLDENHGMLFAFNKPSRVSFWMKNVSLPLDIGYFDSKGRLIEQYVLYPYDESPVFSKSDDIQFVLEMERGWFQKNKLYSGEMLDIEKVRASVYLRQSKGP